MFLSWANFIILGIKFIYKLLGDFFLHKEHWLTQWRIAMLVGSEKIFSGRSG